MAFKKDRVEIVSDVSGRDGIGIEVYQNDELIVEIFRDDTQKTRTITNHKNDISVELMEECINIFRKEIPWDFFND
jgi:hypothetical protein